MRLSLMPIANGRSAVLGWLAVGLCCAAVGGCGADSASLGLGSTGAELPSPGTPSGKRQNWKMAALAPLQGAPDTIHTQMITQITHEAVKRGIIIRGDPGATVDYTLRGYFLVQSVKTNSKVVYVWDVMDHKGVRVNRLAGEEVVASTGARGDKWASVTPAVLAMIADKGLSCLGAAIGEIPVGDSSGTTNASALGKQPN